MGETPENWVTHWNGRSPPLKHDLQLKIREEVEEVDGVSKQKKVILVEIEKQVSGKQVFAGLAGIMDTDGLWSPGPASVYTSPGPYSLQASLVIALFWEEALCLNSLGSQGKGKK